MIRRLSTLAAVALVGGLGCDAASGQIDFYFTADNGVANSTADTIRQGSAGTTLASLPVATGASFNPTPADIDVAGSTLYFADFGNGRDGIWSVPTSGGSITNILDLTATTGTTIFNIAVNPAGTTLYYADANTDTIYSVPTAGGAATPLVSLPTAFGAGAYNPRGVTVDSVNSKVYWTDTTTDALYSANLNGTGATLLYSVAGLGDGSTSPNAVAVDSAGGKVYVIDNDDFITVSNLDGTGASLLTSAATLGGGLEAWSPEDFDFFGGRLYVGDTTNGLWSISTTGSALLRDFSTDVNVRGVAVVPEPASALLLVAAATMFASRRH